MVDHKTPWRVEPDMRSEWVDHRREFSGREYCAGYNILDADDVAVVGVEGITDANDTRAAFIVTAVNHHAQLVEALRFAVEKFRDEWDMGPPSEGWQSDELRNWVDTCDAMLEGL